jgi:hypothetical protein
VEWRTPTARALLSLAGLLVVMGLLLPLFRYNMDVDLVPVRGMTNPIVATVGCAATLAFAFLAIRGPRRSNAAVFAAGLGLIVTALVASTGPSGTSTHPSVGLGVLAMGLVLGAGGALLAQRA